MHRKAAQVSIQSAGLATKIFVDGIDVSASCTKFTLCQIAGDHPNITIDLVADISFSGTADVEMPPSDVEGRHTITE